MGQIFVLVQLRSKLFHIFAELAHLLRVEKIGDEEVASFPDVLKDLVVFETLAEILEGLEPAAGVPVVGIDERAVDVEDDSLEEHARP